jgi:type II secretory pathway component PulF
MEQEILRKLEEQGAMLEAIHRSVERTRRYFFWTLVITILVIILPLIGLMFVVPQFLSVYSGLGI